MLSGKNQTTERTNTEQRPQRDFISTESNRTSCTGHVRALITLPHSIIINFIIMSNEKKFFKIERSESNKEIQAFIPKRDLNINLSIGGTKIITALIDPKGSVLWESEAYKWRHQSEQNHLLSIVEKRKWFISLMIEEILKAKQYHHRHFHDSLIEGVGISWPGPISRDNKLIGPNIDGFKFEQLNSDEIAFGGIAFQEELKSQLRQHNLDDAEIHILNDADCEGYVSFVRKQIDHGTLLILGTGIGAGIIKNGNVYFGPPHFICRMGKSAIIYSMMRTQSLIPIMASPLKGWLSLIQQNLPSWNVWLDLELQNVF